MKLKIRQQLKRRQRRIQRRLDKTKVQGADRPMYTASDIHYEIADRQRGLAHAGPMLWFGKDRAFDVSAENWRGTVHGMRFDMHIAGRTLDVALPLAGPHFMMNFLAAAAAAHHLAVGVPEPGADKRCRARGRTQVPCAGILGPE